MVHKGQTGGVGIDGVDLMASATSHHAHESDVLVGVMQQATGKCSRAHGSDTEY